jgi:hypothetical protein
VGHIERKDTGANGFARYAIERAELDLAGNEGRALLAARDQALWRFVPPSMSSITSRSPMPF